MEYKQEVLECGCVREYIDGKCILIECDEHDIESDPQEHEPFIKKFRKSVYDYV